MKRASQQEMEAAVAFFKSSGLTQREFCRQEQIKLATFSYWYRKINGNPKTPISGFTEVTAPVQSTGLEVVFPNGVTVRGIGDVSLIRQLIKWQDVYAGIFTPVLSPRRGSGHAERF